MTVRAVGLQQGEHLGVVAAGAAGQGPADQVGQVEVADRDGVRVAVAALQGLGGRPGPDPRDGGEAGEGLGVVHRGGLLHPGASRTARMIVAERFGSTPARCHSQLGTRAHSRADGATRRPSAGPGAAVPKSLSRVRQARYASSVVTFCSRIAGTRDSRTSPVRVRRTPAVRRWASRSGPGGSTRASGSSCAPSSAGSRSSSHCAPGPQAVASTSPAPGRASTRSVPIPAGVRDARQIAPSPVVRYAGSAGPRRSGSSVRAASSGKPGRQRRTDSPVTAVRLLRCPAPPPSSTMGI